MNFRKEKTDYEKKLFVTFAKYIFLKCSQNILLSFFNAEIYNFLFVFLTNFLGSVKYYLSIGEGKEHMQ